MWFWGILGLVLVAIIVYDLFQKQHAILRNFPILGHFRYLFEAVGPELRQYIVTSNDEERPFSRDERSWVYASSKKANNYFGFGTDSDLELAGNHLIVMHSAFPLAAPVAGQPGYDPEYQLPCAKVLGGHRQRKHAFRPASLVNVSGMSFGSLSAPAVQALNEGCRLAGCLQSSGEGSVTPHHDQGGELIWQIGTGYFGCRDENGGFSYERFLETVARYPIRAVEIKMSQGAKPGLGGLLPAGKVTEEIAAIRGIPVGQDCISPSSHSAFRDVDSLLDFAEKLAEGTGLPIGIKSAVGELDFWQDLAALMARGGRGLDFITVDGGEGGTGAAPLVFADHVALPFKVGFERVYRTFRAAGVHEQVVFAGSGRIGFPEKALYAMALGCDLINVGRTAMLAIGCIQAQRCHTGHCPTGVATQNAWLTRGLDPALKSARLANYIVTLRKELLQLSRACGYPHPALVPAEHLEILDDRLGSMRMTELLGLEEGWGLPSAEDQAALRDLVAAG